MPQYFFDVFDGVDFVDNEGVLYADLASVRREAVRAAGAMLRDHAADWDGKPWKMNVRDSSSKVIATLTFSAD